MKSKQESIFAPLFDSFIAQRVEQLTTEAEKLPDYIKGRDSLQDLLAKASSVMGPEDLEAMVTAIRGMDVAIHEYVYHVGLKDGIWIAGQFDKLKLGTE